MLTINLYAVLFSFQMYVSNKCHDEFQLLFVAFKRIKEYADSQFYISAVIYAAILHILYLI